jgi:TPR repeat protein
MFHLGVACLRGLGTGEDPEKAVRWFQKAAAAGNADAEFNLGVCHLSGSCVARFAVFCFQNSATAEFPSPSAMHALGECYQVGIGVAEDKAVAFSWFLKAASAGHAVSQYTVGLCFEKGNCVP